VHYGITANNAALAQASLKSPTEQKP